jgi:hypothetical protein
MLDNATACEAATISNKTKQLKSPDQVQLRSVALVLEATTTAHDSRTAMYRLVWSFSLVPGAEYLAVEMGWELNSFRVKLVLHVCNKVLSQFIHMCCYEADETKGSEGLHNQWPNLGPRACCVNFGDLVHHPRRIIFVLCDLWISYSPSRDLHTAKPAAIGLLFRWPCLSIPIYKALALFFICIFRLLPSLNLSYLTFSDLPQFYSIQFYS